MKIYHPTYPLFRLQIDFHIKYILLCYIPNIHVTKKCNYPQDIEKYLAGDLRHKGTESVLSCIYCLLNNWSYVSLISFSFVKIQSPRIKKKINLKSWYVLASVLEKPDSNSLKLFFAILWLLNLMREEN